MGSTAGSMQDAIIVDAITQAWSGLTNKYTAEARAGGPVIQSVPLSVFRERLAGRLDPLFVKTPSEEELRVRWLPEASVRIENNSVYLGDIQLLVRKAHVR